MAVLPVSDYKSPDDVRPIKDRALNVRGQRVRALPNHGGGGAIFPFAFCIDIVGSGAIPAAAAARGGRGGTGGLHANIGESFVMFAPTAAVRTAWMDVLRAAAEVGGDA